MPYLNPARSLGPSFVLNKWDNHWVYWIGPLVGGAFSGLMYQYVFSPRRAFKSSKDADNDSASMNSDDDTNFDIDLEKSQMNQPKFHGSTYRSPTGTLVQQNGYCQNLYTSGITSKFDQVEPLYGGTRSLYCRSPPLTRANLNRSQSVYTKSNTAINRDTLPRPGPLVPAQSLYPMRLNQNQSSHLQNQNVQNHLQQRSESIYGIRSSIRHERTQIDNIQAGFQPVYGTRNEGMLNDGLCKYEREPHRELRDEAKMLMNRSCRPDSMYGVTQRRGQSTQSDDSSYGSYHGPTPPSSSTPLTAAQNRQIGCEMMNMNGNYVTQQPPAPPSAQQMRPQNANERKLSTNGTPNQQPLTYSGQQQQPKPPAHSSNGTTNVGSNAPITHQYNMQPIRQN